MNVFNTISTLTASQWAMLSLVPLGIVLLYFLKLRRESVEIPSTYLWARTVEDLHVNSLFQRIRRNLLLLLQLLTIAFAALALLRPGVRGDASSKGRIVFLLDSSASMMATDVEGDENRFEKARRLIRERIDAMEEQLRRRRHEMKSSSDHGNSNADCSISSTCGMSRRIIQRIWTSSRVRLSVVAMRGVSFSDQRRIAKAICRSYQSIGLRLSGSLGAPERGADGFAPQAAGTYQTPQRLPSRSIPPMPFRYPGSLFWT